MDERKATADWRHWARPRPHAVGRATDWPWKYAIWAASAIMIFAIWLVLGLSYVLHWDQIQNATYCDEETAWLPAASWPIGIFEPQKYLWMFAIMIHFPFSFFYGWIYQRHFGSTNSPWRYSWWYRLTLFMLPIWNLMQMYGLAFTSIMNVEYEFNSHTTAAVFWVVGICGYIGAHSILHYASGWVWHSDRTRVLFKVKVAYFVVAFVVGVTIGITYPFYTAHCHLPAYTLFGLCEYAIGHIQATFILTHYFEFPRARIGLYVVHPDADNDINDFVVPEKATTNGTGAVAAHQNGVRQSLLAETPSSNGVHH